MKRTEETEMNLRKTRFGVVATAVVLAAGLAACGSSGSSKDSATAASSGSTGASKAKTGNPLSGKKVGVIYLALDDPFYQGYQRGIKKYAADNNIQLIEKDGRKDPATMTAAIEQFVVQHVDGIIFSPIDAAAAVVPIKSAENAKIPIIVNGIRAAKGVSYPFVGQEEGVGEEELGKRAAAQFAQQFGKNTPAKIVTMGCPAVEVSVTRANGFVKGFTETDPTAKVIANVDGKCLQEDSVTAMENAIQRGDVPNVLYGVNGIAAIGALQALEASGKLASGAGEPKSLAVYATDGAEQEIVAATKPNSPLRLGHVISPVKLAGLNFDTLGSVVDGKIAATKDSDHLLQTSFLDYTDCSALQAWITNDLLSKTHLTCG
jgi:ABC-type sugar transport system substrate-binding protein